MMQGIGEIDRLDRHPASLRVPLATSDDRYSDCGLNAQLTRLIVADLHGTVV